MSDERFRRTKRQRWPPARAFGASCCWLFSQMAPCRFVREGSSCAITAQVRRHRLRHEATERRLPVWGGGRLGDGGGDSRFRGVGKQTAGFEGGVCLRFRCMASCRTAITQSRANAQSRASGRPLPLRLLSPRQLRASFLPCGGVLTSKTGCGIRRCSRVLPPCL